MSVPAKTTVLHEPYKELKHKLNFSFLWSLGRLHEPYKELKPTKPAIYPIGNYITNEIAWTL